MSKNKQIGVYDRHLIRSILKNKLKTNKIRNAFHDKSWLKVFLERI